MESFSVAILAKNEEKGLPRLFRSLTGVEDIVVLDTGSTDNTVKIAKEAGCNVIEVGDKFKYKATHDQVNKWHQKFGWKPAFQAGSSYFHFGDARNYAASFAKNDFVFCPDCDEEVTWDLNKIHSVLPDQDHLIYRFIYAHNPDGSSALEFTQCKFFRKSKFRWGKWVHEVEEAIPGTNPKPPFYCNFITHHHYQNPSTERGNYLPGLELSVLQNFEDDRNVYYLARELMWMGEWDKAIFMFKKAISIQSWLDERSEAHHFIGNCYKAQGKIDLAIEEYHRAFTDCDTRREPFYALANLFDEQKQLDRALVYYQAAMAIPFKEHGYLNSTSMYGSLIPDRLAFAYARIGDTINSKKWWLETLKYNPDNRVLANFAYYYGYDLPLVSIVVPIVREEGFSRLMNSIKADTSYTNYEVIEMRGEGTAIEKFNKGVEQAKGKFIVFLADDTEVTNGWLVQAYSCWKENFKSKGLVILNDGYWDGRFANHFFCSKNIKEELDGTIWFPGYHHCGADNELYQRLQRKEMVAYAQNAKIIHHHPFVPTRGTQSAPMDEYYERINSCVETDRKMLYKRQKELNFGPKIAIYCTTNNNESIIEEFVRENLKYVDEIFISDNLSTDRTMEIAEKTGAHVRQSGLIHTAEDYNEGKTKQEALEFALRESEAEWMLYMDSDEILEPRAATIFPELINNLQYDAWGFRLPTFWLNRTHVRTDGDFALYLNHPYQMRLFRRTAGVRMTIPSKGWHSFPCVGGNTNTPYPQHFNSSDLCIYHYSFPDESTAWFKYNRYTKADPQSAMSRAVPGYEHLRPDFPGIQLIEWGKEEYVPLPPVINYSIEGWMTPEELGWLYRTATKMTSILEIGSWKGRSTYALLSGCKGIVTAVDTFKGSQDVHDLTYEIGKQQDIYAQFMQNVGHFSNLQVLKMTSEEATVALKDKQFDMIFIDAEHTYEGVKHDIELWKNNATVVLCGHDYVETWPDVQRAVSDSIKIDGVSASIWFKYLTNNELQKT
jgi:glycosyltransferase involved in cell wall biosynthesis